MKNSLVYLLLLLLSISTYAQKETTHSTYFFIRHAEKVLSVKNPHLTKKGIERAKQWSAMLKNYKIDAVLSTDFYRTMETAQPIANANGLKIEKYHPHKLNVDDLKKSTVRKNVVIVGHSNTIPSLVNSFLGKKKYTDIDERIYGNIYIVTVKGNDIRDTLLTLE